jgi:hypothetical protein
MRTHYRRAISSTSDLVIISSAACMPASCWGTYRRIGVAVVDKGTTPAMLSTRARGVRSLRTVERLAARGKRTAFDRALDAEIAAASQVAAWDVGVAS